MPDAQAERMLLLQTEPQLMQYHTYTSHYMLVYYEAVYCLQGRIHTSILLRFFGDD
jgi:hypothetical protein